MVRVLCFAAVFALVAVCAAVPTPVEKTETMPTFDYTSTGSKLIDYILNGFSSLFDSIFLAIDGPIDAITMPIMDMAATIYDRVVELLANLSDTADILGAAAASLHDDVMAFASTIMMQIWDALVAAAPVRP